MRIYTKTGDKGETGLFDGTRVSKADPRVVAYGGVDELNAWLGLVRSAGPPQDIDKLLTRIQRDLFALGAVLADPGHKISSRVNKADLGPDDVLRLEKAIDSFEAELTPLRRFILAGGAPAGAMLHLARTVCRRAERNMVAIGAGRLDEIAIQYINRLSDLLFVLARVINHRAGVPETEW